MRLYYINLDRRPDRREAMEARFAALGLAAERVSAVSPADLTEDQRRRHCDPLAYRYLTEGELCCSLSHVATLRRFAETGEPFALILEDDAVLSPRLPGFLDAFEAAAPAIDLLRIETDTFAMRLERHPEHEIAGIALHRPYSWAAGSAAYIVSRRAALRIASGGEILSHQVDGALFNPYEPLARELVTRQGSPALAIQETLLDGPAGSDLSSVRDSRRAMERAVFPRRVLHDLREFVDRDIRIAALKAWHQYVRGAAKRVIPFADE